MANSPSQKWEDGKLVERAQDVRGESEENAAEAVTGTPTKPHGYPNSTFSSRREARLGAGKGSKAVDKDEAAVEDKAVGRSERKSKGRR